MENIEIFLRHFEKFKTKIDEIIVPNCCAAVISAVSALLPDEINGRQNTEETRVFKMASTVKPKRRAEVLTSRYLLTILLLILTVVKVSTCLLK